MLYTYKLCGRIPQIYHHNVNIGYKTLCGIMLARPDRPGLSKVDADVSDRA